MAKELSNKIIYDDFVSKTILTEDEKKVLDMVLLKYSIVKISQEICMSERNVSRIIREIKDKYSNYKQIEITKMAILIQ